jgi:hypothetical protein
MVSPYRLTDIEVYGGVAGEIGDSPGLNEVSRGAKLRTLVTQYALKVRNIYDGSAPLRSGQMIASTEIDVYIGGYDKKRWVAEITAKVPYAAASELGRHKYNPYEGSGALQNSLYAVLPERI